MYFHEISPWKVTQDSCNRLIQTLTFLLLADITTTIPRPSCFALEPMKWCNTKFSTGWPTPQNKHCTYFGLRTNIKPLLRSRDILINNYQYKCLMWNDKKQIKVPACEARPQFEGRSSHVQSHLIHWIQLTVPLVYTDSVPSQQRTLKEEKTDICLVISVLQRRSLPKTYPVQGVTSVCDEQLQ